MAAAAVAAATGYWQIPRIFTGAVAVLASGPGLTEGVADALRAARIPAIAVNTSFRRAPWAAMLYAADQDWWLCPDHRDAHRFAGLRVTISTSARPPGLSVPDIRVLRNAGVCGWSDRPDELFTLGNGGGQALQLAIKAGATRVLLAGFDFSAARGSHWHGDHPPALKKTEEHTFGHWAERMGRVAPELLRRADIVTVTPSALTCFRAAPLDEEIAVCRAR